MWGPCFIGICYESSARGGMELVGAGQSWRADGPRVRGRANEIGSPSSKTCPRVPRGPRHQRPPPLRTPTAQSKQNLSAMPPNEHICITFVLPQPHIA